MKKMMLCAAALLCGAMAFAQSGQTAPDPLGPGQTTTTTNTSANANANMAETYQLGNLNKVRIGQAGTRQGAYVSQDNGTGTGGNLALVRQTGDVSSASGVENYAEVIQSGSTNGVAVRQEGDENLAVAQQNQRGFGGGENNVGLIRQGTGENAQYNSAELYQDGDRNFGTILQTFDRSSAYASQIGEDNKSKITQNAGPNLSDGHRATNFQAGNNNAATIDQDATPASGGDSGRNEAFSYQDGNDNMSKQIQNTTANEGVMGEIGMISQGWNGISDLDIGGKLDNNGQANSNGATDVLEQLEDVMGSSLVPNISNAGQMESFGGKAVQMQFGRKDAAEIHQFGAAGASSNEAQQNQFGWDQEALIVQNTTGNANGGGNWAFQDQRNDNNVAAIGQKGFDNMAQQKQDGKRNQAFSAQQGRDHKASVSQTGNDSRAETYQGAIGNTIVVNQTDGQSAWVEQNVGGGAAFGGNQAGIIQVGPDGTLPADLGAATINCDFETMMPIAPITPTTVTINDLCPDCN